MKFCNLLKPQNWFYTFSYHYCIVLRTDFMAKFPNILVNGTASSEVVDRDSNTGLHHYAEYVLARLPKFKLFLVESICDNGVMHTGMGG